MSNKNVWKIFEDLTKNLSDEEKKIIDAETKIRDNIALAMIKIREKAGLSQKELAKKLGVSQSWVSRLENANYDHRIESIWKYLKALNSEISLIVNLSTNKETFRILVDEENINIQNENEYKIKFTFYNVSNELEQTRDNFDNLNKTIAS